ncbi:MAG: MBL fold metallo-hydrolase, partial [Patescibacteria group bacterium]
VLGGMVLFSFWREAEPHPDRVIACDVGQGDAVVLQTSKNATVLIDGGPGDAVLACLGQAMPFWDRTIEMIILTHPHADHMTGLNIVRERYKIGMDLSGDSLILSVGQQWQMDQTRLTLLANEQDLGKNDINDQSLVFLWETAYGRALLMGDASVHVEDRIAARDPDLEIDVLKVGHHGSKTSTSDALLDAVKPKFALISAGLRNRYGHPHQAVLDRLRDHKVEAWLTRDDGTIVCDFATSIICRADR